MVDPMVAAARLQLAAVTGWLEMTRVALNGYAHLMEQQARLLEHGAHPWQRWHDVLVQGPDWLDHYGRRSTDIDVEHLR